MQDCDNVLKCIERALKHEKYYDSFSNILQLEKCVTTKEQNRHIYNQILENHKQSYKELRNGNPDIRPLSDIYKFNLISNSEYEIVIQSSIKNIKDTQKHIYTIHPFWRFNSVVENSKSYMKTFWQTFLTTNKPVNNGSILIFPKK
jgi:CRISPR/Cas system CSM-associated protein Csm2 small subunit